MSLEFIGSSKPTIGVEIELQILDSESLDLTPKSEPLLAVCQSQGIKRIKTEIHQSMLEVDSEISSTVKECRAFLKSRITQLNRLANELGLQLAIAGTHPFQRWADRRISKTDRFQKLYSKYQWLIRRMNVYGLHVHIGMASGSQAIAASNSMIRYLPCLLALTANSPFWQGIDTGMQSSRINIMESFPHAGVPKIFKSWDDFEYYYLTLKRAGAINSLKDLYWYLRPNLEFGTIEFRICDAASTLEETMAVVALIQCLVVLTTENLENNSNQCDWTEEQQWLVTENQWIAARDGLNGILISSGNEKRQKISEYILGLVQKLSPIAMRLNCFEELQFIHQMVAKGTGADRQREVFKETRSLKEVVLSSAQEFKETFTDDFFSKAI